MPGSLWAAPSGTPARGIFRVSSAMSTPPPKGPECGDGLPHRRLDAAKLLMQWRDTEITAAQRRYRRLSIEEVQEVYDETVEALLDRLHEDEGHLVRALMIGLRMRCLNKLRDRKRYERRVERMAPAIYEQAEDRSWESDPERALLAAEDNVVISECVAGLTARERQVFALKANGFAFRGIGDALGIDRKVARKLERAVDRKRDVFLKLYETGRLCGYRSRTIDLLLSGQETGELAVREAVAHLRNCRKCQATHKITHKELRSRFEDGALALLPPAMLQRGGAGRWTDRVLALLDRPIRWLDRSVPGSGVARERVLEATAGGAAAAKTAAVVGGVVAVLATGVTVGIHDVSKGGGQGRSASGVSPGRIGSDALTSNLGASGSIGGFYNASRAAGDRRSTHTGSAAAGPGRVLGTEEGPGRVLSDTGSVATPTRSERDEDAATGSSDVPLRPVTSSASGSARAASATEREPPEAERPAVAQQRGGAFTP
jgi:RNA polymerase sigma factor (sigma-70 family)